jgi:hypothetical protein
MLTKLRGGALALLRFLQWCSVLQNMCTIACRQSVCASDWLLVLHREAMHGAGAGTKSGWLKTHCQNQGW